MTSLRAFGAAAVFAHHLFVWGHWHGARVFEPGYAGVTFFFILSGFVLAWSPRGDGARLFWQRRAARIYPAYLVMFLIALVVPRVESGRSVAAVVLQPLLVQAWVPKADIAFGVSAVSWSLSCEAFFYAVFPAMLLLQRRVPMPVAWAVVGVWFLAVAGFVLAAAGPLDTARMVATTNPLVHLVEFTAGMLAAVAMGKGWRPPVSWPVAAGIALACFAAISWRTPAYPAANVVLAPVLLLVVMTAARADIDGRPGPLAMAPLRYAGQISYCFYLVHNLVILNLVYVLGHALGPATALLALVLSVAASVVLHHAVERPLERRLRPGPLPAPRSA